MGDLDSEEDIDPKFLNIHTNTQRGRNTQWLKETQILSSAHLPDEEEDFGNSSSGTSPPRRQPQLRFPEYVIKAVESL